MIGIGLQREVAAIEYLHHRLRIIALAGWLLRLAEQRKDRVRQQPGQAATLLTPEEFSSVRVCKHSDRSVVLRSH
ncbi:hypothetical protein [Candidatus Pantoea gossypiicola]|uniref:hypothetical protein n=1 Tax=Pantoea TaxID=53335 RepID=UPI0034E1F528